MKTIKNGTKGLLAILIAIFVLILVSNTVICANSQIFPDVPVNHWSYSYVTNLYKKGIINGYEDGTFKPTNNLTRGQAAKMIALSAGLNYFGKKANFPDVPENHEMSPYIAALVDASAIIGFSDGTFRMYQDITRKQIAQIVAKGFGLKKGGIPVKFQDLPAGGYSRLIRTPILA